MASIAKAPNGTRTIQFVGSDGKRRSIRLGKVTQRQAEAVKYRVESLNVAAITRNPWDTDLAQWVAGIGDELADRLAAVGLIPRRLSALLDNFCTKYIERRTDIKPRTKINLEACKSRLVEFFGANRALMSITAGDADAWLLWLRERYADGTSGRTVKRAKQLFRSAMRSKLITANPFEDVKPPSQVNEARKHFVSRQVIQSVLDACPDTEWRLIVALCRYGGIRCPSELLPLQWADVNWERGRFLVYSPKTEHHQSGESRWVPIFPELRPFLVEAFEQAAPGTVYLVNRSRDSSINLRTRFTKIIRRAGVTPWPKLFQNLRATRETELAAEFPLHIVCSWIGNSALVAQKHYLQVTDSDFEKAIGKGRSSGAESGAVSAEAVQFPVQSAFDSSCPGLTQPLMDVELGQLLSNVVHSLQAQKVPPRGLEPLSLP